MSPTDDTCRSADRVWRACIECRKRKTKCDGKEPSCNNCCLRGRICEYPLTKDNAASNRHQTAKFETRCLQIDEICSKMDFLMNRLSNTVEEVDRTRQSLASFDVVRRDRAMSLEESRLQTQAESEDLDNADGRSINGFQAPEDSSTEKLSHFEHLALDSYGKQRFVGGPSNMIMIEAIQSLFQISLPVVQQEGDNAGQSPVSTRSKDSASQSIADLPFFTPGLQWPRLPYLPGPEHLGQPPAYVSDPLVDLFFRYIHHTFPILDKREFLARYQILSSRPGGFASTNTEFLAVLYSVCACGSSLLPSQSGSEARFQGIEYYQKALLLCYGSSGQSSIEQVQCIGLLALRCAGFNTLAAAWKLAGQAVRMAQDLGLHVDIMSKVPDDAQRREQELRRRVWWSVYTLDRIISLCLGRPFAVADSDCSTGLPDSLGESIPEKLSSPDSEAPDGPLIGFVTLAELSETAGEILRLARARPSRRRLNTRGITANRRQMFNTELNEWLENIPDVIKYSPNRLDEDEPVHLTMYVIGSFVYAGAVMNLHSASLQSPRGGPDGDNEPFSTETDLDASREQCTRAARSCIQMGNLIRARVPPSHYLAFCVHQLALSGMILLRMFPTRPISSQIIHDVEKCICHLEELESVSSGAARSKDILQSLLVRTNEAEGVFSQYAEELFGRSDLDMDFFFDGIYS